MMRKGTGRVLVLLLMAALLAIPFVAGCGESSMTITEGKITMGSDTAYPPFESMEGSKAVGFDVDVAEAIAKKLDLKLEVIPTAWDGIIPGLKANKYDIIMSAMTITADRKKQINFSDPYIDSNQSLAVVKGSTIKTVDDLKDKIVGVQIDTTGQFKAEELQPTVGIKEIQKFDTILLAYEALEQGKVDAIINDYPVNMYISTTRAESGTGVETEVVAKIVTDEQYGIGVSMDNDELLKKINQALSDIKDDGTYEEIYVDWFGVAPTS